MVEVRLRPIDVRPLLLQLGCGDNLIIEPQHNACGLDETEEMLGKFIVGGCDTPPRLKIAKEALDAPTVLLGDAIIIVTLLVAMSAR